MAETVYILCALTSLTCALLLLRSYFRKRSPILLWTSIGFVGFALNNFMLVADMILFPSIDLSIPRMIPGFLGGMTMLAGILWELVR